MSERQCFVLHRRVSLFLRTEVLYSMFVVLLAVVETCVSVCIPICRAISYHAFPLSITLISMSRGFSSYVLSLATIRSADTATEQNKTKSTNTKRHHT